MEKTEFEIRESVLAHCTHLLGEIQVEGKKPYPEYPDISCFIDDGVIANYTVWPFGDHSSFFIIIYTDRAVVDDQWKKAYRLLGLDKRDALEAERGKSAKLIEALEEINNVPTKMQESIDIYKESGYQLKTDSELVEKIAEFGFGELEFHTADIERLVTQSGIAFNALEAYKEGKKDA